MEYVEKLEAEHVLKALKSIGWAPGKRPPTYVDLRLQCKEMFGNGGDGNRLKELREQAIAMEIGVSLTICEAEPTPHRLPEDLQGVMKVLARDIGDRLTLFDSAAAACLERHRATADADAIARINASRRESSEQSEAYDEEISAALSAIQARDSIIEKLEAKLSLALTDTAHAEGRASVLSDQVAAQLARIVDLEQECGKVHTECKRLTGRIQELEMASNKFADNTNGKTKKSTRPKTKTDVTEQNMDAVVCGVEGDK